MSLLMAADYSVRSALDASIVVVDGRRQPANQMPPKNAAGDVEVKSTL